MEKEDFEKELKDLQERIEKLKKIISDYLTLGNEFARASLITALKNI